MNCRRRFRKAGVVAVAFLWCAASAWAQTDSRARGAAIQGVAGYGGFIDEEMVHHVVVGASLLVPMSARLAIEGGLLHLRGPGSDRDWLFSAGVVFDLRTSGRIVPYLTGGGGWLRSTLPVGTGLYTSGWWTAGGGAGMRVALTPRTFAALEGRLGTEPLTRLTAAIGWRFE